MKPALERSSEEALRAIEAIKPESLDDPSELPLPPEFSLQYQLRREVLELISQHDAEWAKKLGDQTGIELSTLLTRSPSTQIKPNSQVSGLGQCD